MGGIMKCWVIVGEFGSTEGVFGDVPDATDFTAGTFIRVYFGYKSLRLCCVVIN